jgi:hypothetical protein
MDQTSSLRPARREGDRPQVLIRLFVSGRSEYTQMVLENVESIARRYSRDDLIVQIRDAADAEEGERVFFTPMLIVQDGRDPDRRTVVVGDLRQPAVLTALLTEHGLVPQRS